MGVTPTQPGHLGDEGYQALSEDGYIELGNNRKLAFTDSNQLTKESITSTGKISFLYQKADAAPKKLSIKIGQNTPLYTQIQERLSSGQAEQVAIKALVLKYVATLLDAHEIGHNGVKTVSAQFDSSNNCTTVLAGNNTVGGASKTWPGKSGQKKRTVIEHLTHLATQKKFDRVFEKATVNKVFEKATVNKVFQKAIETVPPVEERGKVDTELQTAISGAQTEIEDGEAKGLSAALDKQEKIWRAHEDIDAQINAFFAREDTSTLEGATKTFERLKGQINLPRPRGEGSIGAWYTTQLETLQQAVSSGEAQPFLQLKSDWLGIIGKSEYDHVKDLLSMGDQAKGRLEKVDSSHECIRFLNAQTIAYTQEIQRRLEATLREKEELLKLLPTESELLKNLQEAGEGEGGNLGVGGDRSVVKEEERDIIEDQFPDTASLVATYSKCWKSGKGDFEDVPFDREAFIAAMQSCAKRCPFHSEFEPESHQGFIQKKDLEPGTKVYVRADLHGDLKSFIENLETLKQQGLLDKKFKCQNGAQLVFCGDYADRGSYSLQVLQLLATLKMENPENVHVIRGNHEYLAVNVGRDSGEPGGKFFQSGFADPKLKEFLCEEGEKEANLAAVKAFYESMPLTLYLAQKGDPKQYVQFTHGLFELDVDL